MAGTHFVERKLYAVAAEAQGGVRPLTRGAVAGKSLDPASDYVRVRVQSFFDPSAEGSSNGKWRSREGLVDHTAVHLSIRSTAHDGDEAEIGLTTFLSPATSGQLVGGRSSRMIQRDLNALGPIPYRSDLNMEIALFSVQNAEAYSGALDMLTGLARRASLPFVNEARDFAGMLGDGINSMLGFKDGFRLEIGLSQALAADGQCGLFVVAYNGSGDLEPEALGVRTSDQRLVRLSDNRPVQEPHIVFEIDHAETRPDWARVPYLREAWQEARDLTFGGAGADEVVAALRRFQRVVMLSHDLTERHAGLIVQWVEDRIHGLSATFESAFESGFGGFRDLGALEALQSHDGEIRNTDFGTGNDFETMSEMDFDIEDHLRAVEEFPQDFLRAVRIVFLNEGGHVDDPFDFGGETNLGITQETLNNWRDKKRWPRESVRKITHAEALEIYFEDYWQATACEDLPSPALRYILMDTAVLFGGPKAQAMLQMVLLKHLPTKLGSGPVKRFVDGRIGARTLEILDRALREPGGLEKLVTAYLSLRAGYHRTRVIQTFHRPSEHQGHHIVGWLNRVREMHKVALGQEPPEDAYGVSVPPEVGGHQEAAPRRANASAEPVEPVRSNAFRPAINAGDLLDMVFGFGDLDEEEDEHDDFETLGADDVCESHLTPSLPPLEIDALAGQLSTNEQLIEWLKTQKKRRAFADMKAVGEAAEQARAVSLAARNLVTQAYNEMGLFEDARRRADAVIAEAAGADGKPLPGLEADWQEAVGHKGRAFKQEYVAWKTDNPGLLPGTDQAVRLQSAIEQYGQLFHAGLDKAIWGGVNVAACMHLANQDRVPTGLNISIERVSELVIDRVQARASRLAELADQPGSAEHQSLLEDRAWDIASEAEALLALGRFSEARETYTDLIRHQMNEWTARKAATPEAKFSDFVLSSAFRQLHEVWGLGPNHPDQDARDLYNHFHLIIARLPNTDTVFSLDDVDGLDDSAFESGDDFIEEADAFLEAIYDDYEPIPADEWCNRFQKALRAIARITSNRRNARGEYRAIGTGFLVDGRVFSEAWAGEKLFVTNEHVISEPVPGHSPGTALRPASARISFTIGDRDNEYKVKEVLWQSTRWHHDVIICRLDREPPHIEPFTEWIDPLRPLDEYSPPLDVTVIGHPRGRSISFSPQNTRVVNHDGPDHQSLGRPERVHYKASTEPGNSGSPTLEWTSLNPIGIHHAGRGYQFEYQSLPGGNWRARRRRPDVTANEAISLASVRRAIARRPEGIV